MSTTTKNFDHTAAAQHWYQHWVSKKYFSSVPNHQPPYTIVIPPPNVTGVLHMGHCLNNTIQDVLARRARMQGFNVCWVPGTDHASIATEAKVVAMLRERGISKSSLSRPQFLEYAWEWKEKYGGIILNQLQELGCSLDWDRVNFTMDANYYQSVIQVFNDWYKKGLIYRGKRMINWDPKAKTALSDEEVIYREVQSKLYNVAYPITLADGTQTTITIATVRPETILGDTAICVHPTDERYAHLKNATAQVPLTNRQIPIIFDEYVDKEFGTGALKVTPAHDVNDYALAQKHSLQVIDIMNDDGTMNADAGEFVGQDRFEARKRIAEKLDAEKYLLKVEEYTNQIGFSERSDAVVEPRLSLQWWVSMKQLAAPALEVVEKNDIQFYPSKFKNLYRHWMENVKDWCISRQLWWGHQIPAWYDDAGNVYVAQTVEEATQQAIEKTGDKNVVLKQDEDCLDTWFSSQLWPIEVFRGISNPNNAEINYYYPTNTLVTAPEIIFFWVARMIISGLDYQKAIPFKQVYFTGIVRDKLGRKMSKSLGNSPDLLELIAQNGADAVRFGIMIASPAGNDLLFDESSIEQGKHFTNKLWNAMKLLSMWKEKQADIPPTAEDEFASEWFENRLSTVMQEVDTLLHQFKLSEALKVLYSLIWNDYCSWYLEWIKPNYETAISTHVLVKANEFFGRLLQLLHPYMPFITEELHHTIGAATTDLCVIQLPAAKPANEGILQTGTLLQNVITQIRDARNKNQLKPKDTIEVFIETANPQAYSKVLSVLAKQVNASNISFTKEVVNNAIIATYEQDKFYLTTTVELNTEALLATLQKDLAYQQGFKTSVEKKLSNEKFVQNAKPEVVEIERKKLADAEARIQTILESLASLQNS